MEIELTAQLQVKITASRGDTVVLSQEEATALRDWLKRAFPRKPPKAKK